MAVSDRIAVMNQGSVVQEGTAEDLYYRPASEFVATFVGRVNLVPGQVVARDGEAMTVSALRTTLRARATGPDAGDRTAVRLVLRPEAIALVPAEGAAIVATVRSRMFLGDKIEYTLDCAGTVLQAVRHSAEDRERAAVGATVGLRFAEGTIAALPGDAP